MAICRWQCRPRAVEGRKPAMLPAIRSRAGPHTSACLPPLPPLRGPRPPAPPQGAAIGRPPDHIWVNWPMGQAFRTCPAGPCRNPAGGDRRPALRRRGVAPPPVLGRSRQDPPTAISRRVLFPELLCTPRSRGGLSGQMQFRAPCPRDCRRGIRLGAFRRRLSPPDAYLGHIDSTPSLWHHSPGSPRAKEWPLTSARGCCAPPAAPGPPCRSPPRTGHPRS